MDKDGGGAACIAVVGTTLAINFAIAEHTAFIAGGDYAVSAGRHSAELHRLAIARRL